MRSKIIDKQKVYADNIKIWQVDRVFLLCMRYLSSSIGLHQRVASSHPKIAFLVFWMTTNFIKLIHKLFRNLFPSRYTDADPYKLIYVDPERIESTTGEIYSKRRGWVVDGEWDKEGRVYMKRSNPTAIRQRFVEGVAWEDTVFSEKYNKPKFDERTEAVEKLYNRIREDGYKSQCQLLSESPENAWNGLNDAMHPLTNEVSVDIGRNGEFLWNLCGQHRLAIAKILDVNRIPVQVFRRHADWQEIRDKARRNREVPEEYLKHPDLQDVLNSSRSQNNNSRGEDACRNTHE